MATNELKFNAELHELETSFRKLYKDLNDWRKETPGYFEPNLSEDSSIRDNERRKIIKLVSETKRNLVKKLPDFQTEIGEKADALSSILVSQAQTMENYRGTGKISESYLARLKEDLPELQKSAGIDGTEEIDPLFRELMNRGVLSQKVELPELETRLREAYKDLNDWRKETPGYFEPNLSGNSSIRVSEFQKINASGNTIKAEFHEKNPELWDGIEEKVDEWSSILKTQAQSMGKYVKTGTISKDDLKKLMEGLPDLQKSTGIVGTEEIDPLIGELMNREIILQKAELQEACRQIDEWRNKRENYFNSQITANENSTIFREEMEKIDQLIDKARNAVVKNHPELEKQVNMLMNDVQGTIRYQASLGRCREFGNMNEAEKKGLDECKETLEKCTGYDGSEYVNKLKMIEAETRFRELYEALNTWRKETPGYFGRDLSGDNSIKASEYRQISQFVNQTKGELVKKYPEIQTKIEENAGNLSSMLNTQAQAMEKFRKTGRMSEDYSKLLKSDLRELQRLIGVDNGTNKPDPLIEELTSRGIIKQGKEEWYQEAKKMGEPTVNDKGRGGKQEPPKGKERGD